MGGTGMVMALAEMIPKLTIRYTVPSMEYTT